MDEIGGRIERFGGEDKFSMELPKYILARAQHVSQPYHVFLGRLN